MREGERERESESEKRVNEIEQKQTSHNYKRIKDQIFPNLSFSSVDGLKCYSMMKVTTSMERMPYC